MTRDEKYTTKKTFKIECNAKPCSNFVSERMYGLYICRTKVAKDKQYCDFKGLFSHDEWR